MVGSALRCGPLFPGRLGEPSPLLTEAIRAYGHPEPLPIQVWQLGNETSYSSKRFDRDTAIAKTIEFSKAMRQADPGIKLIGWGDSGWARPMIKRAGKHINFVAFHHLFDSGRSKPDSPCATAITIRTPRLRGTC